MSVIITPHLTFDGDARAAIDHYRRVFGGDVVTATPTSDDRPSPGDLVEALGIIDVARPPRSELAELVSEDTPRLTVTNADRTPLTRGAGPSLSVFGHDVDELTDVWDRLAADATVFSPLAPTDDTPLRGELRDRFGVEWLVEARPIPDDVPM